MTGPAMPLLAQANETAVNALGAAKFEVEYAAVPGALLTVS